MCTSLAMLYTDRKRFVKLQLAVIGDKPSLGLSLTTPLCTNPAEESCHWCLFCVEEDKKVLDACEKWLQQAEALVIEADAKIEGIMHQDTGNLLAEEWVTFVHKYSMQIKDIEQVSSE